MASSVVVSAAAVPAGAASAPSPRTAGKRQRRCWGLFLTWRARGGREREAQVTRCCDTQKRKPASRISCRSISRNREGGKTLTKRQTCVTRAANRGDQDPPDVLLRQEAPASARSGDQGR